MTGIEVRNALVVALYDYLGRPVVLSDQTVPESEYPYVTIQAVQPYIPRGGANIIYELVDSTGGFARDINTRREEYAEATYSFSACSRNRDDIFGDDEALELAEKSQGFFRHTGRYILQDAGISVIEIMNVQNRSGLVVDEIDRRYGFDVRVRYQRVDTRRDGTIEHMATIYKEG